MNTRPIILLTLWTLLIGPVMAMPANGKGSPSRAQQPTASADKPTLPPVQTHRK